MDKKTYINSQNFDSQRRLSLYCIPDLRNDCLILKRVRRTRARDLKVGSVWKIHGLKDIDVGTVKIINCRKQNILLISFQHKPSIENFKSRKAKIILFSSSNFRVLKVLSQNTTSLDDFTDFLFCKNKVALRSRNLVYVVNLQTSKWKFQPISTTDQVFLVNKKDYASSPSKRVRIIHGLTFIDSGM